MGSEVSENTVMLNFAQISADPEFASLSPSEKAKAIASLDKEFARLEPTEQAKAIASLFPSASTTANARLAGQGLTPEDVKAGRGVTTPDQIAFAPPKQVNGGFVGGALSAINPLNIPGGVAHALATPFTKLAHGQMPTGTDMLSAETLGMVPNFGEIADESYRRGAANISRSDMYGGAAAAAATFGALKGIPTLAERAARGAPAQYQSVIDPMNANPQLAGPIAQELLDAKVTMRNPQAELPQILENKAAGVDTTSPIHGRPMAARSGPILDTIRQARENLYNEKMRVPEPPTKEFTALLIKKLKAANPGAEVFPDGSGEIVVRVIRHPQMQAISDGLHELERHIKTTANRGMIPNDTLANLHSDYNYYADKAGAFEGTETNPVRWPPNAHASGAIRDVVNQDPASEAANAQKSFYLQAKNELPGGAAKDTLPSTKRVLLTTGGALATEIGAAAIPGSRPLLMFGKAAMGVGGIGSVGRLLYDAVKSPAYKTRSAIVKAGLGRAIAMKDWDSVRAIAQGIIGSSQNSNMNQ